MDPPQPVGIVPQEFAAQVLGTQEGTGDAEADGAEVGVRELEIEAADVKEIVLEGESEAAAVLVAVDVAEGLELREIEGELEAAGTPPPLEIRAAPPEVGERRLQLEPEAHRV